MGGEEYDEEREKKYAGTQNDLDYQRQL
jgi:hypothetical protein